MSFAEGNLNLRQLVETSIRVCTSANPKNKIPVVANFDSSIPDWILGDEAVNGLEAVSVVSKSPYDLIFMDLQMPTMDGYEAMRIIRANDAIIQPRIIVISANVQPEDVSNSYSTGADGFLPKPINREAMVNIIDALS